MSTDKDSVDQLAAALKQDDELREELAEEIVQRMNVDDQTPEGQAAQTYRRQVLKGLGVLGTGAALGGAGGMAATQSARAGTDQAGTIGTASDPVDIEAEDINSESVQTDDLNNDRIYDTHGQYLGTLTGSGDATTLESAISNRKPGAGLILPDPGFALDWDKTVNLPTSEEAFTLVTWGTPKLTIPSGFGDSYALKIPGDTINDFYENRNWHIGDFAVDDPNNITTAALKWDSVQFSTLAGLRAQGTQAVEVRANDSAASRNIFRNVHVNTQSRDVPAIEFRDDSFEARENLIVNPFVQSTAALSPAYLDECQGNIWLNSHAGPLGDGAIVHQQEQGGYTIIEGNWDDSSSIDDCVKEVDNVRGDPPSGYIRLHGDRVDKFATLNINSPKTTVERAGGNMGENDMGGVTDLFDGLNRVTPANSLSDIGVRDFSNGGASVSLSTGGSAFALDFSTGTTSGDQAIIDQGGIHFFRPRDLPPKLAWRNAALDTSQVLVVVGFFTDPSNRVQLIYDPTNHLGNHSTDNWYAEVETGGTLRGRTDTGVKPATTQYLGINRMSADSTGDWTFHIGQTEGARIGNGGTDIGRTEFRYSVETLESADKNWQIRNSRGARYLLP